METVAFILSLYDQINSLANNVPVIRDRQWWAMFLNSCRLAEPHDPDSIRMFVDVLRQKADNFGDGKAFGMPRSVCEIRPTIIAKTRASKPQTIASHLTLSIRRASRDLHRTTYCED